MPQQQIVPTWVAWNNANFTSPTALTDLRTGLPFAAGGLNLGDYFDATEQEANMASYTTNGTLHSGRYRYVQVDSGATAAYVKTGTVGYVRAGSVVQSVVISNAGSGQTAGTYNISATGGYGTGAVVQVVVGSGGTVTSATLLQGGNNYVSVPVFTLAGVTGGASTGTVLAQLSTTPNVVTSYDQAVTAGYSGPVYPVVYLNSITPGCYGFIQELGVATVLGGGSAAGSVGQFISSAATGVVAIGSTNPTVNTIGQAIDLPTNNVLFKVYLSGPVAQD